MMIRPENSAPPSPAKCMALIKRTRNHWCSGTPTVLSATMSLLMISSVFNSREETTSSGSQASMSTVLLCSLISTWMMETVLEWWRGVLVQAESGIHSVRSVETLCVVRRVRPGYRVSATMRERCQKQQQQQQQLQLFLPQLP